MHIDPGKPSIADRLTRRLIRYIVAFGNRYGDHFTTYNERPKRIDRIDSWPEAQVDTPATAIVMQGPISEDDQFTVETLKLYQQHMPQCRLILSTWADTSAALIEPVRRLGVEVVLSDKPKVSGLFNINMQLVSAATGVEAAAAGGAQWVMKTRTDQRLYYPNVLNALMSLIKSFPLKTELNQKHRIIGIGQGSLKFAPYHITDQTMFGHVEDMLLYWTPPLRAIEPLEHWPDNLEDIFVNVPILELCRHAAAECYLTSSFLQRIGRPLDWTLADTWAAYRDHFCFLDYSASDFYWEKGQKVSMRENLTSYDMVSNRHEMSFREWLQLYSGTLSCEAAAQYEHMLTTRFNSPVVSSS